MWQIDGQASEWWMMDRVRADRTLWVRSFQKSIKCDMPERDAVRGQASRRRRRCERPGRQLGVVTGNQFQDLRRALGRLARLLFFFRRVCEKWRMIDRFALLWWVMGLGCSFCIFFFIFNQLNEPKFTQSVNFLQLKSNKITSYEKKKSQVTPMNFSIFKLFKQTTIF